jgi:cytoplasmic iron level regulating protein YaaA (DUF328/UPF0246 family)
MQAYRLEMGTRFANAKGDNLYEFWGSRLAKSLNSDLNAEKKRTLVNLASNEYFNAIQTDKLDAEIITPVFKDYSNGKYRFLSFFAKQARGMMAAYIVKNRINSVEKLKTFDTSGYNFNVDESTANKLVFLRKKPQ